MIDRYGRQTILPEIGLVGQQKLKDCRVLVVGVGGLGCPLATYLAAAGIGTLGLVDPDSVSLDNLHRQPLYLTEDIGEPKAFIAARRLKALNPDVDFEIHSTRLDGENAEQLVARYDIVCDGTDNFAARYAINDACVAKMKPNVHASVFQFHGQLSVFVPGGPCYRCLFPRPPASGFAPSCAEAGVLGVLPGILGSLQAAEVLKLALGIGQPAAGRLVTYDALTATFEEIAFEKDPACPCCGERDPQALRESIRSCATSVKEPMSGSLPVVTPAELQAELAGPNPPRLLDVRELDELSISVLPGVLHIPLGELMARQSELDREAKWVIICRSGARSANVTAYLLHIGFKDARNLATGMNGWARTVDPTMPVY